MMGALAEFERALIIERIRAGLAAAERRGAKLYAGTRLRLPRSATLASWLGGRTACRCGAIARRFVRDAILRIRT